VERKRTESLELLTHEADNFIGTLRTLRSLKEVAHPSAESLDQNPVWRDAILKQADKIAAAKRDVFLATMVEAFPLVLAFLSGSGRTFINLDASTEPEVETDPIELVPKSLREDLAASRAKLAEDLIAEPDFKMTRAQSGRITVHFDDPMIRYHFWEAIREIETGVSSPTHAALLMRSILTMAVSAFEVLVANVYKSFLMSNPGAAEGAEVKLFSLRDLYDFGSVEDAVDETIFQQADAFSRKGMRAWAAWFKTRPLEVDLCGLAYDWLGTQEIFERRNVVVHNGSRVTRQYLNNVDSSLTKDLLEGRPLEITPAYVEESLERLLTLGTLLAYKVRVRLFRRENFDATCGWIADEQFKLLKNGEYHAVNHISLCVKPDNVADATRLIMQVNGWIAKMRLDGVDACNGDIAAWDTSALSDTFRAVQQVLLRDDVRAVAAIQQLLDTGDITELDVREWPLFHWFHQDGVLDDLLAKFDAVQQSDSIDVKAEAQDPQA
jgi:hypothetical protein